MQPQLRQGGHIDSDVALDLSTCVNPYGPPAQVVDALRSVDSELIKRHPYEAAENVANVYSQHLAVDADELIAVRGASEAIWHLSNVGFDPVALPLPTYTEYLRAFPKAIRIAGQGAHDIEQIESAAQQATLVVLSNPHNPTGSVVERSQLLDLVSRHPETGFVFDESYADFLGHEHVSMVGVDTDNVVVISSPTKFYGLGGVRIGVVWTRNELVRSSLLKQRTTWPVSAIDAHVVDVALQQTDWARGVRTALSEDALWLCKWLEGFDVEVHEGALHFRLVTGDVQSMLDRLATQKVQARALEAAHGFDQPAVRISAPPLTRRFLLENA